MELLIVIGIGILFLVMYRFLPKSLPRMSRYSRRRKRFDRRTMAFLLSVAVIGCALYIILSPKYVGESERWAFGAMGIIIGFWLRPEPERTIF